MSFVLSTLRSDAKDWWWFRELRKRGDEKEASKLERQSILSHVSDLRKTKANGGWLLIRPNGGWTLNYAEGAMLTGYSGHRGIPTVAEHVGITVVDFRGCDENIMFSVWMWEPNPWRPDPPVKPGIWDTHRRCPLWWYLDRCADVGATIHNYPKSKR